MYWQIVYRDGEMDREMRRDGKPLAVVDANSQEEALRYYRADRQDKFSMAGYEVTAIPVPRETKQ
jgi:hypothetical protein